MPKAKAVLIIGGGGAGITAALEFRKRGYYVTIYEKNPDICMGLTGTYGLRLHDGSHYPQSAATRESCRNGRDDFEQAFPELVIKHQKSKSIS